MIDEVICQYVKCYSGTTDLYEAAWNRSTLTPAGSAPSVLLSLRDLGSKTHFIPVSSEKSYYTLRRLVAKPWYASISVR